MKEKKILKTLKIISLVLVVILFVEVGLLVYNSFFKEDHFLYFDSINASSNDGSSYIAVGSNNNNSKHYEKAKITKYDSKGNKKYEKLYNKGFNSVFFDVITEEDGYVAVGSYEKSREEHDKKVRSALIVKYDKSGKVVFENSFQVLGNSKFVNIWAVEDGYLVVGQSVYEKMTLGLSKDGGAFLIKYDKNGRILWKKNYGDNKTAIFNDLVVVDNYIYVVGKNDLNLGIILKYDLEGNFIKVNIYEDTDGLGFTSIVKSSSSLVVTSSKLVENKADALLVKYDFDLNYLDEATYSQDEHSRFNKLVVDKNEDLIVIGSIYNSKSLKYDAVISKYRSDLREVKSVRYGDIHNDYFSDILLRDDSYYVSGYSSYADGSYLSKYVVYSDALKVLEVR